MPTLPDDTKQFINSEFARRIETDGLPEYKVLVETRQGLATEIADELDSVNGFSVDTSGIIQDQYIPLVVKREEIPDLARIDGVELVHQDQLTGVLQMPTPDSLPGLPTIQNNPLSRMASEALYDVLGPGDEGAGQVRISEVEVPQFNFAQLPIGDPGEAALSAFDAATGSNTSGEEIIPTSRCVEWIRDSNVTDGAIATTTKVGIIDTGHTPTEPENGARAPRLESMVPLEPPLDFMGHGSWCTNMVTGNSSPGPWGRTGGVAPGSVYGHFKALNTFPGVGRTSWILKAMGSCLEWGADVVSMSLGGTQQGPVGEDPYTRFISENCKENAGDEDGAIFVAAAGNAGPDEFTLGSPGVSPKALTVGSWSLTDAAPAVFSSRGPQGDWYADNPERLQDDIDKFGAFEFVKPDVVAPGGGRKNSDLAAETDEILSQSSTGWYDGLKDGLKDGRSNMKGTSMATPAVAGLVKRLYDAGIIDTAAEVKQVAQSNATVAEYGDAASGANTTRGGKNIAVGFGPLRESLFAP